jgi:hypothetical protein
MHFISHMTFPTRQSSYIMTPIASCLMFDFSFPTSTSSISNARLVVSSNAVRHTWYCSGKCSVTYSSMDSFAWLRKYCLVILSHGSEKTLEWTSQIYFDNSVNEQVHKQPPYSKHGPPDMTNIQYIYISPICKKGEHYDPVQKKCVSDCPPGFHLEKGVCTKNIVINVKKKITTTYQTIFKNFFVNPNQPKYLLLLDTAQLCQLAGDTQCVSKQNQFNTLNLVTRLDSTGKTWSITGQVENRVSKTQNNVQIIAYFYDSKGNNVAGRIKVQLIQQY